MPNMKRHRHVKRHSSVTLLDNAELSIGAGAPYDSAVWTEFTLTLRTRNAADESFTVRFNRAEAERIVRQFAEYLERDTRRPWPVNGSKGHA